MGLKGIVKRYQEWRDRKAWEYVKAHGYVFQPTITANTCDTKTLQARIFVSEEEAEILGKESTCDFAWDILAEKLSHEVIKRATIRVEEDEHGKTFTASVRVVVE